MPSYLSPGVFVEEVDTGSRPIEAVGTSTAGFVGAAPLEDARLDEAVAINNWAQFKKEFVGESQNGTPLANAVYGFFENGGSRCYVVNTKSALGAKGKALDALARIDEIAIIAAPGMTDVASTSALIDSAEGLADRFAICDGPATVADVESLTRVADIGTGASEEPAAPKPPKAPKPPQGGMRPRMSDRGYGAFYFPWLRVYDAVSNKIVSVPPSGHLAGIYARTDTERGVHKAPANVSIRGALGVTQHVSRAEQDVLNPAGVNCIRFFTREGVRVWGARTLAPSASNWRYIPVRRLFTMVEESITLNLKWVVFEPNNLFLWKQIQSDVGAFLERIRKQGALQGATPSEAFFVKCDDETNPPEVIDAGEIVTLIGMAPVKPAEFVIFRIGQSQAGTKVEAA